MAEPITKSPEAQRDDRYEEVLLRILLALQGIDLSLSRIADKPPVTITTINGTPTDGE